MKLYSINGEPFKDPALLEEHGAAREIGIVRLGEEDLFFRVRLRTYFIPYKDIVRAFRRVFTVPANVCCGKGQMDMEYLVICDEEKELAQIQLPGEKAAKEVMRVLGEKAPHVKLKKPSGNRASAESTGENDRTGSLSPIPETRI